MAIDYRPAQRADLPALLQLMEPYAREQQEMVPINNLTENFMELASVGLGQALNHPAGCVMVAVETQGQSPVIVGYAIGMMQEPPAIFEPEAYTFVSDLYILPEFRRRGIGTGLVDRVRAWGWSKGINRLSLVLPNGNVAALKLYEKLGFQPIQTMLYYKDETSEN
jgi:ribosomal protein S18 acetylase RimI-like enzyme